jgi:hypothetical protein
MKDFPSTAFSADGKEEKSLGHFFLLPLLGSQRRGIV